MINHERLFRLYREEKLAVRRRGGIGQSDQGDDLGSDGTRRPLVAQNGPTPLRFGPQEL